jgi:2-C-methyl-D-erythritol 4-phosphate cytidylyltransferase
MGGNTCAIIVAGGSSTRMAQFGDKLFADLCGKSVLQRSIEAFQKADSIDRIIVVNDSKADLIDGWGFSKIVKIIAGGENRMQSVINAIDSIDLNGTVAIHDGARPLITPSLIDTVVANAPAIPAVAVSDTVKRVNVGESIPTVPIIQATLDRRELFAAQTPQVFDLQQYRQAVKLHFSRGGTTADITDDSAVMEQAGHKVTIVHNHEHIERNIKITTPQDLITARALIYEYD